VLYTISAWEHPNARGDTALGDRHERRSHVWLVPTSGGTPRQLTYGERGESQPSWSPDGRTIAFVTARGSGTGDDAPRPQLWLLPADGGEARQLTTSRERVSATCGHRTARHIAYLATDTLTREQEAKRVAVTIRRCTRATSPEPHLGGRRGLARGATQGHVAAPSR
jgi:dipeptidyl aminopeptidase/acylaminoacyl peptidase